MSLWLNSLIDTSHSHIDIEIHHHLYFHNAVEGKYHRRYYENYI